MHSPSVKEGEDGNTAPADDVDVRPVGEGQVGDADCGGGHEEGSGGQAQRLPVTRGSELCIELVGVEKCSDAAFCDAFGDRDEEGGKWCERRLSFLVHPQMGASYRCYDESRMVSEVLASVRGPTQMIRPINTAATAFSIG